MEFSISTCFNIYLYIEENKINKLQNIIVFCLLVEAAAARSGIRREWLRNICCFFWSFSSSFNHFQRSQTVGYFNISDHELYGTMLDTYVDSTTVLLNLERDRRHAREPCG